MFDKNITIKKLDTGVFIEDACALLYKVYYEEVIWNFSEDNPSQLRIEIRNNRKVLVDRFTDKAIWFGAFDGEILIGCARLTFVDEKDQLEVEGYKNSWIIQRYFPKDKSRCAELTRAAVLPSYRGRGIVRHLFLAIFQYCEDHQYSVCATPNHGYIVKLLKEIGWPLKMELAFKYEENDPNPVNFNFANYEKSEVKNVISNLVSYKTSTDPNHAKILDALEMVAPILPTPVYWHDRKGVVLGINANCLKAIGASRDIIGKTPYEFYSKDVAEHILKHNEQVIETGEILSQDEFMRDIVTGKTKIFRSTKAPLCDDEGKIIGIIGSSIEVTAERDAERLKIENEKQRILLSGEEKFRKLANKVAHDIRSPLSTLLMIVKDCTEISESKRIALREAARGIGDIANHLLHQYQKKEIVPKNFENTQAILVSAALMELLTAKRYQYESSQVKFNCHFKPNAQFACTQIQASAFKRMISNLMNNAVDAFADKMGQVDLQLEADNEWLRISIKDTGKGMPRELIEKIMNKTAFTSGKASGHGIGLTQVWETLDNYHGELRIDSQLGQGTTLILRFPRAKTPHWMTEEILLNTNDIVIILDDDTSIHSAWKIRFESILSQNPDMKLKHFEEGSKALEFIHALSTEEKNRAFLLSDYELLEQELNGLHIISQSGISRSILVTSHYADPVLQENTTQTGTKILPKQLASEVHIKMIETDKVDIVIVEDNESLLKSLLKFVFTDKIVAPYSKPEDFLKSVRKYPRDTKIYLDNNYDNSSIKGIDIAKELHEKGYTRLYLLSGELFAKGELPDYLTVIGKDDIDSLEKSKDD